MPEPAALNPPLTWGPILLSRNPPPRGAASGSPGAPRTPAGQAARGQAGREDVQSQTSGSGWKWCPRRRQAWAPSRVTGGSVTWLRSPRSCSCGTVLLLGAHTCFPGGTRPASRNLPESVPRSAQMCRHRRAATVPEKGPCSPWWSFLRRWCGWVYRSPLWPCALRAIMSMLSLSPRSWRREAGCRPCPLPGFLSPLPSGTHTHAELLGKAGKTGCRAW